jgi:hypothetical protein
MGEHMSMWSTIQRILGEKRSTASKAEDGEKYDIDARKRARNDEGYEQWKGPWLIYNGHTYPLDIPGLHADRATVIEVDNRRGRMMQSIHGGSVNGCSMSNGSINGISLDEYIARFQS